MPGWILEFIIKAGYWVLAHLIFSVFVGRLFETMDTMLI